MVSTATTQKLNLTWLPVGGIKMDVKTAVALRRPTADSAHFGVNRKQYNQTYRTAYTRGYQHGSRL